MKSKKAQSIVEYFIIFSLILAVILSTGITERMRGIFSTYFDAAAEKMR